MNMLLLFGKIIAGLLVLLAVLKVLDIIASAILVKRRDELRREKARAERLNKTLDYLEIIRKSQKVWYPEYNDPAPPKMKPFTIIDETGEYPPVEPGIVIYEPAPETNVGYYENLQAAIELQKTIAHILPQKVENSYNLEIFLREVYDKILAQGWFYVNFKDAVHYHVGGRTYITYKNDCGSISKLIEVTRIQLPLATNLHKIFFKEVE